MGTLTFTDLDLDLPAGSRNKTATLATGEQEAVLVDAGFTRADGHRGRLKAWATLGANLDFIRHNPQMPDGAEGLRIGLAADGGKIGYEMGTLVADGDFVTVHGRYTGWAPTPLTPAGPDHRPRSGSAGQNITVGRPIGRPTAMFCHLGDARETAAP